MSGIRCKGSGISFEHCIRVISFFRAFNPMNRGRRRRFGEIRRNEPMERGGVSDFAHSGETSP